MAFCRFFRGQTGTYLKCLGFGFLWASVVGTRSRIQLCRYRRNVPPELRSGFFRNGLQHLAGEYALLSFKLSSNELYVVWKGKAKLVPWTWTWLPGCFLSIPRFPYGSLISAQKRNKGAFSQWRFDVWQSCHSNIYSGCSVNQNFI